MTTTWNIDASHSTIGFAIRHMVFSKVRGRFLKFTGAIHEFVFDPTDFAYYRARHDVVRVIQSVVDPIGLAEARLLAA